MKIQNIQLHEPGDLPEPTLFSPRGNGGFACPPVARDLSFPVGVRGFFMPAIADQRATDRNRVAETAPPSLERLHVFLDKLATGGFYGKVTVSFQNGKAHDVKIEQTKKLEEL